MGKLAEAYPSPPGRPGKYALYFSRHGDDDTQVMVQVFAAAYAARKFLDVVLEDDGIIWENDCTIRSETGIVVSTKWYPERMKKVVEHEYTLEEMAWDLQNPHLAEAKRFRYGPPQPRTLEEDAGGTRAREKRERRAKGPTVSAPAGYVHVSDVALSMGIEPKQARVALRKIYPDGKPAYGWYFDPKTLDDLKAKIREQLK